MLLTAVRATTNDDKNLRDVAFLRPGSLNPQIQEQSDENGTQIRRQGCGLVVAERLRDLAQRAIYIGKCILLHAGLARPRRILIRVPHHSVTDRIRRDALAKRRDGADHVAGETPRQPVGSPDYETHVSALLIMGIQSGDLKICQLSGHCLSVVEEDDTLTLTWTWFGPG